MKINKITFIVFMTDKWGDHISRTLGISSHNVQNLQTKSNVTYNVVSLKESSTSSSLNISFMLNFVGHSVSITTFLMTSIFILDLNC